MLNWLIMIPVGRILADAVATLVYDSGFRRSCEALADVVGERFI